MGLNDWLERDGLTKHTALFAEHPIGLGTLL